ncbi:MAG: IclR family transcriptional regulator, partial [Tissierellia bacterium]|nr:IclR family transcriptional regulator [Tissierellia bacterium]
MTTHKPTKRVLDVLNYISSSNEGKNLTDISNQLNISPSTLQPILKTLLNEGFIDVDNFKFYRIGINSFITGQKYVNNTNTFSIIKKEMKEIVHKCNEICQLGVHDNIEPGNVIYLYKEEPYQAIQLMSSIGLSLPAYASALGKCLLSQFTDEEIKMIYNHGMEKLTNNTITDVDILIKQIREMEKLGYSHEVGESSPDIECYAI